ncbi:dipeptide epimerase [Fodinibius salsisoli]|uniref:Dipeptide epimerase n=1 Tax=Fodinibius salsisoli TaxID=2820877 RepID=A0ABT3PRV1_9BACT|nr:dipeptide epimerase [Fodinibius salsisoli]MCW9708592.1 dipeptide epimerase [Fodinibius salsisoli]
MPHFNLSWETFDLQLDQPFTIARGTKTHVRNVFVELHSDGMTGYGEADPNKRYEEDAATVTGYLEQLPATFFDSVASPDQLHQKIEHLSVEPVQSAKSAIETAWLDWWGQQEGQPLWKLWEAPSNITPPTSYTIGLDTTEVMQQKVRDAEDYPILKVKLGTDRDREIIKAIREVTDKPIRVDANEGWTTLQEAKDQISFLAEQDIELVEQPMPAAMHRAMTELKAWSPLPLMADESFKGDENLDQVATEFDGINIKLSKIGSLVKARKVIEHARERNLKVMIGCMISSSVAITAGALLGTYADYVDLDGHLLIKDDPFTGATLDEKKRLVLSDKPGLRLAVNSD